MSKKTLAQTILLLAALGPAALAADRYLVRVSPSKIGDVVARHGLTLVRSLQGSANGLYLVQAPPGMDSRQVAADTSVQSLELDGVLHLPETAADFSSQASTQINGLGAPTVATLNGVPALGAYVNQPAGAVIALGAARTFATGAGAVVAILDTGVDPNHPVLKNSLLTGYDFTRNTSGGSELADLAQSTTAILDQSTTAILDHAKLPAAFGHGTMVAGLVHLVAPAAKILPVKVFTSDGSTTVDQIAAGIDWAVAHGADVISMSFSSSQGSPLLQTAITNATNAGVICVASAGNDGQPVVVYPAAYNVIGVGSTNDSMVRSSFSNYGPNVDLAAPGEGDITLYPYNNYAAGWGTSFSAPLVSGSAALLVQIASSTNESQATQALSKAIPIGQQLGAGELNALLACLYQYIHSR